MPRAVRRAWTAFCDWANVPLYRNVLRIDAVLAALGLIAVGGGYLQGGWFYAAQNGLAFVLVLMSVQLLRRD